MDDQLTNDFIIEVFKEGIKDVRPFFNWIGSEIKAKDILGVGVKKYRESLEERYGTFRIFCMSTPAAVRTLYVSANFLEKLSARNYRSVENLEKFFTSGEFGNYSDVLTFPGIQLFQKISSKIVIYGKPGAGKTTFLKRILLHSLDGEFEISHIPVFITLKNWADSNKELFDYILQEFKVFNFPSGMLDLKTLLKKGKCLILLDGLDEISERDARSCILKIEAFVSEYFNNSYMMTCRVAARAHIFEQFAEVEISDFNKDQISNFVKNWFDDKQKRETCEQRIFAESGILEMAKTPLLLTMLCAAFEGAGDFPLNRAELYKEAIDILLKKWDSSRTIERDEIYKNLSLKRKEDLLSVIAYETFSNHKAFMTKTTIEKYIKGYIENLDFDENRLEFDSAVILNAMEAQHGIIVEHAKNAYSFSHLTFQEYYTAKFIINNKLIDSVVEKYFGTKRWEEVFILIANMLDDVETFYDSMFTQYQLLGYKDQIKNLVFRIIDVFKEGEYVRFFKSLSTEELLACPQIIAYLKNFEFSWSWMINLEAFEVTLSNTTHTRGVSTHNYYPVSQLKNEIKGFDFYPSRFLLRCLNTEIYLSRAKRLEYKNILENSFENQLAGKMRIFAGSKSH